MTDLGYEYRGGWLAAGRGRDLRLFVLSAGGIVAAVHPIGVLVALVIIATLTNATVLRRTWISWDHARGCAPFGDRPLRAVILDFDGTVADTMGYLSDLAVGLVTRHYDVQTPQALSAYMETTGLDFASQVEKMFPGHTSNSTVIAAMEEQKRCGLLESSTFADVVPALRFFKARGVSVFICSSTRRELVQEFLSSAGLDDLVDAAFGFSAGLTKDRQIDGILREYGLSPSEVILVGDSFADQDFARRVGVRFVGLARMFKAAEFKKRGIFSVNELSELTRLYQRWDGLIAFRLVARDRD